MTAIFAKDSDKKLAVELRRLLIRVQNSDREDRGLDADIREAFGLPHTIGDPTSCADCALWLANFLKFDLPTIAAWTGEKLKARCREGWKTLEDVTNADIARAVTCCVLKGQIARLERAPG